jgi:hypothetical protein
MPSGQDSILGPAIGQAENAVALEDARGRKTLAVMRGQLQTVSTSLDRLLRRQMRVLGGSPETQLSGAATVVLIGLSARAVERAVQLLNTRLDIQRSYALGAAATQTHAIVTGMERLLGNQSSFSRAALLQVMQTSGLDEPLLTLQRASVERYGAALVKEVNRTLYAGLRDGLPQRELVDQVGALIARKKWWAERIVRTETSRAYNSATDAAIRAYNAEGTPLKKKIIAFFDNRTAYDSVYVHGQVRAPGEYFVDGAGRQYLYPPARPNDREVIIPWSTRWPEGARTLPSSVQSPINVAS